MRRRHRLRRNLGVCLLVGGILPAGAGAARDDAPAVLPPVVVSGERAGPGLWQVSGARGQVWILGTVSPLPVGMTWRAGEVTRVLGAVDEVVFARPVELSAPRVLWMLIAHRDLLLLPGGKTLREVLPPELYARFAALRAQTGEGGDQWERDRPIIAGALLEDRALSRVGLSNRLDVSLAVRRLAREKHVPITELQTPGAPDLLAALRSLPAAAEQACLATLVAAVETGLPALAARADAWASGNIERLRALPPSSETACASSLSGTGAEIAAWQRTEDAWLTALEGRLQGSGATLAVIDLDLLLGAHGLLQELADFGYRVEEP